MATFLSFIFYSLLVCFTLTSNFRVQRVSPGTIVVDPKLPRSTPCNGLPGFVKHDISAYFVMHTRVISANGKPPGGRVQLAMRSACPVERSLEWGSMLQVATRVLLTMGNCRFLVVYYEVCTVDGGNFLAVASL